MAERRIPRADADFSTYMNQYTPAVAKWWEDQGLDADRLTDLNKALTVWNAALPAHLAAQNAAEAARQSKDAARQGLESAARPISAFIQAYPATTNTDRAAIGITVRDTSNTPSSTPTSRPVAFVRSSERLMHTLRLSDEATPTRRARPRGVLGAEVWCALVNAGEPVPANPSTLTYLTIATGPSLTTDFSMADGGKTAVYMLRWVGTRGQKGPWSDAAMATVAA